MPTKHATTASGAGPALEQAGQLRRIGLDLLRFDAENPRVVELLGDSPGQTEIEELLNGADMRARDLIPSFVANGYIPYEPLVVREEDAHYVVLEGNRRLAALRALPQSEDLVDLAAFESHGLSAVPCLVFSGDTRQLLSYLGLRHLSKTKDWSTSAKGAFVERILDQGYDLKEAGRLTNTTTPNLRLILLTRRLFEKAVELGLDLPSSSAEGEVLFWHLGDAVRRKRTKAYLQLQMNPDPLQPPEYDESRFEFLLGWLYGSRKTRQPRLITSIRDIPKLDRCLDSRRAIQVLEEGGTLAEAEEELESAGATVAGHIDRAGRSLRRALAGRWSEIDEAGLQDVEKRLEAVLDTADELRAVVERRKDKQAVDRQGAAGRERA